jgi:ATP phosphoribosyltransferase regulatory subunit
LRGGTIEVGHAGVVAGLFADLDEVTRESVLGDLRRGDQVGAFRRAHDAGMTERAIAQARRALAARGRDAEALDIPGVSELREVLDLARRMFAGDWGVPNLGLVPALPYYTGIVFEALHPAVGFPIAAGGRYDVLLAAFGAARAATGFAINVPRLHLALFDSGWRPSAQQALIALLPGDAATTARLAARLRGVGLAVAIGSVAEPAGNTVVSASVVDAEHVRLGDGRTLTADELVRSLPMSTAVPTGSGV